MTHTCYCGVSFEVVGGWNQYGNILRCPDCEEARKQLLDRIHEAMTETRVDTLCISMDVRHLVSMEDFDGTYEVSFLRPHRLEGHDFQIIEQDEDKWEEEI